MSWNPDADLDYAQKQQVLRDYFDRYRPEYVIETGLYAMRGSCFQFVDEASVIAFDPEITNRRAALRAGCIYTAADSRDLAPVLRVLVDAPAMFWLDAHAVVEHREDNSSALREELAAIREWPHAHRSVVLIDDMRMMGLPGWPTLTEVRALTEGLWDREERDDVMRLTPKEVE